MAGVVAGGVLRFVALGHLPLGCDELASLRRATELGTLEHLNALRGNHPLYEVAVLRPWAMATTSDAGIRLPSAAAGTLALLAAWAAGTAFGPKAAALGVWVLALSPLHFLYSRIARPYALASLFAALGLWALLAAARGRRFRAFAGYAASSALMALTNLFSASLCAVQGLFLVWFHRKRPRRLLPWVGVGAAVCALAGPWLITQAPSAVQWSAETPYAAQQLGTAVKALYVPFAFALGETVHPLNWAVVLPAALGFAVCCLGGLRTALRHRAALLMFVCFAGVMALGLAFRAAAPKHMLVAMPAFSVFVAAGALALRPKWLGAAALAVCFATQAASVGNYFAGRDFHDASFVTPWREIAHAIEERERPEDALIVGYLGDPDIWRMFRRYYHGALNPVWLGDLGPLDAPAEWLGEGRTWLLLHETDPRDKIEGWIRSAGYETAKQGFQMEEHTLRGLREGLASARKYRSYLYQLYLVEALGKP